jgi:hypothetical protein
MASPSTSKFESAKKTAVAQFLSKAAPGPEFAALTASTSRRENIVGVGIGPKVTDGRLTKRLSIRFYVERKVAKGAVPKKDMLPAKIDGVPTDVIETGRFYAFATPIAQKRLRPTRGGCSCGFQASGFVMAGTLGCLVTDGGGRFILSNNHVLADENALPLGSPIFQPGLLDNGNASTDKVARLSKFVTIKKLPAKNEVDCAIAGVLTQNLCSPKFLPKVSLGSTTPIAAAVGMKVHKHGRTTGYTRGQVVDIAADVNVGYDFGTARFIDQVIVIGDSGSFSDSGDSGSLIVDRKTKKATGLLFAGSSSHTIANHIENVLSQLGVTLVK